MGEAQDANSNGAQKENTALGKIETVKNEATSPDTKSPAIKKISDDNRINMEKSLISAIILVLREYGIRKSGAAVRDAVDISHQYVGPKEAASALSRLGFKASFGSLNISNLPEEFFPLIAFKKNAEVFVILTAPTDGNISITDPVSRKKTEISTADYKADFSQYTIIAKELNKREKEERSGHCKKGCS